MKKKILFSSGGTGGHVFPSISLINFFKKKEYETIFVTDKRGAKYVKKNFSLHKIFDVSFPTRVGFVNKRLLPTTGITLPFLSYGGSSIVGSAIIAGLILNLTKKVPLNQDSL